MKDHNNTKRRQLLAVLEMLASDALIDGRCPDVIHKLADIYQDGFRHRYSELFPLIVKIDESQTMQITTLLISLETLSSYIDQHKDDLGLSADDWERLRTQYCKLTDHLDLEIGRYEYHTKNRSEIINLAKDTEELSKRLVSLAKAGKYTSQELTKAKQDLSSTQTQTVAVLGVFAAIVTTFAGGLSYLNGTLVNLANTPTSKAIVIVSLCGLVILNTVYTLMRSIEHIIGRPSKLKVQRVRNERALLGRTRLLMLSIPRIVWLDVILLFIFVTTLFFDHATR